MGRCWEREKGLTTYKRMGASRGTFRGASRPLKIVGIAEKKKKKKKKKQARTNCKRRGSRRSPTVGGVGVVGPLENGIEKENRQGREGASCPAERRPQKDVIRERGLTSSSKNPGPPKEKENPRGNIPQSRFKNSFPGPKAQRRSLPRAASVGGRRASESWGELEKALVGEGAGGRRRWRL